MPKRKHPRLKQHDYSEPGAYFITVCTKNKAHILSRIVVDLPSSVRRDALIRRGETLPLLQTLQAIRRDRCSPSAAKGNAITSQVLAPAGRCAMIPHIGLYPGISPHHMPHTRVRTMCVPTGLYRDKTQFSAPDCILILTVRTPNGLAGHHLPHTALFPALFPVQYCHPHGIHHNSAALTATLCRRPAVW